MKTTHPFCKAIPGHCNVPRIMNDGLSFPFLPENLTKLRGCALLIKEFSRLQLIAQNSSLDG